MSSITPPRWARGRAGQQSTPNATTPTSACTALDLLTYTTAPHENNLKVVGHPTAGVWLGTQASDLDFFIYLEEVDRDGVSSYVTEGQLRASHRQLGTAPFKNLGLPFPSHLKSDLRPIRVGSPVELVFALLPTAHEFLRGNRIRISVGCADADNFETTVLDPAPKVELLRGSAKSSLVELPIVMTATDSNRDEQHVLEAPDRAMAKV
jgi:uncharacterized protein